MKKLIFAATPSRRFELLYMSSTKYIVIKKLKFLEPLHSQIEDQKIRFPRRKLVQQEYFIGLFTFFSRIVIP